MRSPAIVSRHGRFFSGASASIKTSKPLRGTTEPTETSRTTPSLLPLAVSPRSVPGQRNGDEIGRNVVIVDQKLRGRGAVDNDAARGRKRVVLARPQGLHVGRRETRFQRQRMMHQGEQEMFLAQFFRGLGQHAQRQPVDDDRTVLRHAGKLVAGRSLGGRVRARKAVAQPDDVDLPAELLQFRDHAAVVGIASGRRVEIAGHRKRDALHHNGAS